MQSMSNEDNHLDNEIEEDINKKDEFNEYSRDDPSDQHKVDEDDDEYLWMEEEQENDNNQMLEIKREED